MRKRDIDSTSGATYARLKNQTPRLFRCKIELGEKCFHEIVRNPAPLDTNTLKALKRSPRGLAARSGAE